MSAPLLELADVTLTLRQRVLLNNIHLTLYPGQITALIGANGAGKSTLFKCVAGEYRPQGSIRLFGKVRQQWCPAKLAKKMAVLPQQSSLQFPFLAKEVVSMGRIPYACSEHINAPIIEQAMRQATVWQLRDAPYPQLSGGEQQRVHFARVLAQLAEPIEPEQKQQQKQEQEQQPTNKLLLLDEPTSALDLGQQHGLLQSAQRLAAAGCGVLVIVHDLNLAARYGDQLVLLDKGQLIARGSAEQVLTPANVARYFGYEASLLQSPNGHPILV